MKVKLGKAEHWARLYQSSLKSLIRQEELMNELMGKYMKEIGIRQEKINKRRITELLATHKRQDKVMKIFKRMTQKTDGDPKETKSIKFLTDERSTIKVDSSTTEIGSVDAKELLGSCKTHQDCSIKRYNSVAGKDNKAKNLGAVLGNLNHAVIDDSCTFSGVSRRTKEYRESDIKDDFHSKFKVLLDNALVEIYWTEEEKKKLKDIKDKINSSEDTKVKDEANNIAIGLKETMISGNRARPDKVLFNEANKGEITMDKPSDIKETLNERGKRYGKFTGHAAISKDLRDVMAATSSWEHLTPDKQEALIIIMHKVARILNGDPEYADSWHDIAGYATLVRDEINKGGN